MAAKRSVGVGVYGIFMDATVTLILWMYYLLGFIFLFSPFYFFAFFFSANREVSFQKLNSILYRGFFALLRLLVPRVTWLISDAVYAIRSSVIVANHQSFLDPILFISLFLRQKTVVKKRYFPVPIFGWILKASGYIPAFAGDDGADVFLEQVGKMQGYLAGGGNLFMFPEGTRSRDGRIGSFDRGAFRLAKLCGAPLKVVVIRNTGRLYIPGRFLFNTRERFAISVELAGTLVPDYNSDAFSLPVLMDQAHRLMEEKVNP